MNDLAAYCAEALELARHHARARGAPAVEVGDIAEAWAEYRRRLEALPAIGAPGFVAQMVAPPQPAAILGYLAAMLFNPNNHDLRHAAPTIAMEAEVIAALAAMLGFPAAARGHLTSGGTAANLDGVWRCRQGRGGAVAFSTDAHFVHRRICRLIGAEAITIACDGRGRIDLDHLEAALRENHVGTVVLSAGTPGMGAVDPIDEVLALRRRYDFAIHVDASYGGFFALLKDDPLIPARAFAAIADCDSVAIDPHKHGYQPYGCGGVLFRDGAKPGFAEDSPYTDAAPDSGFECSRPGAAAGALWLTLRALPLESAAGFGPLLRACLEAARALATRLAADPRFVLNGWPELGVVSFFPAAAESAAITAASRRLLAAAAGEGIFLSSLRIAGERLRPGLMGETEILRAVLMKPGVDPLALHAALARLADACA